MEKEKLKSVLGLQEPCVMTNGKEGKRAYLTGADLRGVYCGGLEFLLFR